MNDPERSQVLQDPANAGIIAAIRSIYGEQSNWNKVADYIHAGAFRLRPNGQWNFKGGILDRHSFDSAQ